MIVTRRAARAASATAAPVLEPPVAPESTPASTTLLDLLLSATDAEGGSGTAAGRIFLTNEELLDNAVTFLFAGTAHWAEAYALWLLMSLILRSGHETTSQALTYALYLLAKHPEWQVR